MITSGEASTDTVVNVHHAGNAVESEAVELILLHIEPKIAEKESENFVRPIVEQPAIPELMAAFYAFVEVKVVGAVKLVDAVEDVLAGMRVHDVEEDCEAHSVRRVDEFFELLWGAIAGACSKETRNLVPKCYESHEKRHGSEVRNLQA